MAAYRATGNLTSSDFGERAASWLLGFFEDDDPLVRQDASDIEWASILDSDRDHSAIVMAYLNSPAFDHRSDRLMRAMEERVSQFPELTFATVDRVMKLSGGWTLEARRGHISTLHHLGRLLIELYRGVAVGGDAERKTLDLFDTYLARDDYGTRTEIAAYERH